MVNQDFINAINNNDITLAKVIFENHMITDSSFKEVDEMIEYVNSKGVDFFESHNGEIFEIDPNNLSDDDIDEQIVLLHDNYSLERVAFIKRISRALYCGEPFIQKTATPIFEKHIEESSNQEYKSQSNHDTDYSADSDKSTIDAKKIAVAIGAICVVAIIVAIVAIVK